MTVGKLKIRWSSRWHGTDALAASATATCRRR